MNNERSGSRNEPLLFFRLCMWKCSNICCLLLMAYSLFAQKENNIWYIGRAHLLNFNNVPADAIYETELNNRKKITYIETVGLNSVVCDSTGDLLFLTNGYQIIDRTYTRMKNSDSIDVTINPMMPAVSLKMPGEAQMYYLFQLKGGRSFSGLNGIAKYIDGKLYRVTIDMSGNNGLGIVDTARSDFIRGGLTSKMVLARANCGGIWLITHEVDSRNFLSFKIDNIGIHNPVVSEVGHLITSSVPNKENLYKFSEGLLSVSPDYKKLLVCGGKDNFAEILSFDQETGVVSNPISLPVKQDSLSHNFGCFSPDSRKIYIGETNHKLEKDDTTTTFWQYDLETYTELEIVNSKKYIGESARNSRNGVIQVGPDSNLYFITGGWLGAIQNPNDQYPQFIENVDSAYIGGWFSLNNPLVLPDPPSFRDSTFLLSDTLLCAGDAIRMDLGSLGDRFLWQDGSTDALYTITKPGKYWAQVERGNCTFYDTMVVEPKWVEGLDIPQDTLLCPGDSIIISLPGDFDFRWQDGSLENPYSIRQAGTYWVAIQDSGCVVQDTTIVQDVSFQPVLPDALSLCEGETLELDIPYDIVGWDDGSINPHHILDGPGVYWLDYLDQGCLFRDSMQVVAGYCEDCRVYVPNIFSPNGDGHNDVLAIQTNCTLSTFSWQIWDRWGTPVFSTRDPSVSWDGRVGQSMAPVGVYVFRMNGLTPNGEVRDQGTITLIR